MIVRLERYEDVLNKAIRKRIYFLRGISDTIDSFHQAGKELVVSKIRVVAGDLEEGVWRGIGGGILPLTISRNTQAHPFKGESIVLSATLSSAELVDEASVKKIAGTAAWGVVGAVLLGPIGAIGGMLIGGNKKDICFAAKLDDGRQFLATTDGKTWRAILAITYKKRSEQGHST